MKTNFGDLVAQNMLNVLNSKEHARLFKKAYTEEDSSMNASDTNNVSCTHCMDKGDCSMCGDGNMADDMGDYSLDDADVSWIDDMMSEEAPLESMASKKVQAAYSALEDLITASAALDYADLGKASELTIKLATLVSEAKKGKVDMKSGKASAKKAPAKKAPAKKDQASSSSSSSKDKKAPSSSSSTSSKKEEKKEEKSTGSTKSTSSTKGKSAPAVKGKMTMKERMEALRAKKK